jgi:hypothetical protein
MDEAHLQICAARPQVEMDLVHGCTDVQHKAADHWHLFGGQTASYQAPRQQDLQEPPPRQQDLQE